MGADFMGALGMTPLTVYRPCPACPDGSVWTRDGPTGKVCPVCKGHAILPNEDVLEEPAISSAAG